MPRGVYKNPKERGKKISKSLIGNKRALGHTPWNKGKKLSEEIIEKLRQSHKGKLLGRKLPEEHKKRIGQSVKKSWIKRYPRKPSEETRRKLREIRLGKKRPSLSEEWKRKISEARKGKYVGEKSPNWKGGISFEPYSIDWTETLKRAIRERDNYICQLCSQYGNNVHHIDYNKQNCNPNNLITLCVRCNAKVNFNREYWKQYFQKKII